ncbi:MAG: signal peptidase I [Dehalococcoidia bacterium]|jgi:signal peptidase
MPTWFPELDLAGLGPRRALHIAAWSGAGIVLLLVVLMAIPAMLSLVGFRAYVIYGGSMGSALPVGSVGLSQTVDSTSLKVGDVIAVKRAGGGLPILHRIVDIKADGDSTLYVTQGDKNSSPDPTPARLQGTGDRVVFAIPYLGYLVHFARGGMGRILLLFLPSSMLLGSVLLDRPRPAPQPTYVSRGEPEC